MSQFQLCGHFILDLHLSNGCDLFPAQQSIGFPGRVVCYPTSTQTASPWAMPEQMAHTPDFLPERLSS